MAINDARIKIDHIHWYVPQYTPSIQQEGMLCKQILCKTPTELRYIEPSVFLKQVNIQILWNFELGSQENMNIPIRIIIVFQQRDRQQTQNLKNDIFYRLHVASAQCLITTEKNPDAVILLNYDDDEYTQGYSQIEGIFRALTKDFILQPKKSDYNFRSSNAGVVELGYNLYVFDIRYRQNFTAAQPIKVEFKFD